MAKKDPEHKYIITESSTMCRDGNPVNGNCGIWWRDWNCWLRNVKPGDDGFPVTGFPLAFWLLSASAPEGAW